MNEHKIRLLFFTFLKIGAFTFGGGYAMIPLIEKEVVHRHKWITDEDILDVVAIAESTPGPIAVNAATFVGYKVAGFAGAFFSTLGVVLPSFMIILILSWFINAFEHLQVVKDAFWGVRIAVLALICKALITMYKSCPKDILSYLLMVFAFVSVIFFNLNVLIVIIVCAIVGIGSQFIKGGEKA